MMTKQIAGYPGRYRDAVLTWTIHPSTGEAWAVHDDLRAVLEPDDGNWALWMSDESGAVQIQTALFSGGRLEALQHATRWLLENRRPSELVAEIARVEDAMTITFAPAARKVGFERLADLNAMAARSFLAAGQPVQSRAHSLQARTWDEQARAMEEVAS